MLYGFHAPAKKSSHDANSLSGTRQGSSVKGCIARFLASAQTLNMVVFVVLVPTSTAAALITPHTPIPSLILLYACSTSSESRRVEECTTVLSRERARGGTLSGVGFGTEQTEQDTTQR